MGYAYRAPASEGPPRAFFSIRGRIQYLDRRPDSSGARPSIGGPLSVSKLERVIILFGASNKLL